MLEESSVDPGTAPAVVDARVGDLIAGKYRVIRALGIGASGTVLLCEHTALQKAVAVKVLHRELAEDPGLVERFQREARTTARLDHPNSVRVTDFGQDERGTLYLAMEYVAGLDLADLLTTQWPLSDERILHIMTGVLSALSAAHALGIVHRDLKPENILVSKVTEADSTTEVVKVCDFGIAQLSQPAVPVAEREREREAIAETNTSSRRITGDGMIVGTCAYMSPEQARAQPLDARSDLYAAGVVLYQLLTRTLPFQDESPLAVAVMHCDTLPPPPSTHRHVNPALEAVCLQALSKTPGARFQTATEMLVAVQAAVRPPRVSRSFWPLARTSTSMLAAVPPVSTGTALVRHGSIVPTELESPPPQPARGRKRMASLVILGASLALPAFAAVPFLSNRDEEQDESTLEPLTPQATATTVSTTGAATAPEQEFGIAVETARVAWAPPASAAAVRKEAPPSTARVVVARERKPAAKPAPAKPAAAPASRIPAVNPPEPEASDPANAPIVQLALASVSPAPATSAAEPREPSHTASALNEQSRPTHQPTAAATHATLSPTTGPATEGPQEHVLTSLTGGGPVHATVVLDHVSGGASKASVRAAINHAALERCYRVGTTALSSTAKLEVSTNMSGRIVSAAVSDTTLPDTVRSCIEQVARSGQIRDADVGQVRATFSLSLEH